ncbi:hypothetical protein K491DRAFT_722461 [Lophiostoma macrostomum CBS 122681]|uniref:Uncharacterized protein n=1 Tax=Lophiostoma macrostomum CBS 122681 TaxID=1314788 RepID=A0A6A6SLT4_9PLEO|nr:hypothetical protein K491DRAFT_722461 [Lophiostoma macrostomum CBS 122681]
MAAQQKPGPQASTAMVQTEIVMGSQAAIEEQPSITPTEAHFPFLRLPGELRNKIYAYAVGGHVIDVRSYDLLVARNTKIHKSVMTKDLSFCLANLSGSSRKLMGT